MWFHKCLCLELEQRQLIALQPFLWVLQVRLSSGGVHHCAKFVGKLGSVSSHVFWILQFDENPILFSLWWSKYLYLRTSTMARTIQEWGTIMEGIVSLYGMLIICWYVSVCMELNSAPYLWFHMCMFKFLLGTFLSQALGQPTSSILVSLILCEGVPYVYGICVEFLQVPSTQTLQGIFH